MHALRDCPRSTALWLQLVPLQHRAVLFMGELQTWLQFNIMDAIKLKAGGYWVPLWASACYQIWRWRNKCAHEPAFVWPVELWRIIERFHASYRHVRALHNRTSQSHKKVINVKWLPPDGSWVCFAYRWGV